MDHSEKEPLRLLAEESTLKFREGILTIHKQNGECKYFFTPILEHFPEYWELQNKNNKLKMELREEIRRREIAEASLQCHRQKEREEQEQKEKEREEQKQKQDKLQSQLFQLQKEMELVRKENEGHKKNYDEMAKRNSDLDDALGDASTKERQLSYEKTVAERNAKTHSDSLESALQEVTNLKDKLKDKEEVNQDLIKQLAEVREGLRVEQNRSNGLQQRLNDEFTLTATKINELKRTEESLAGANHDNITLRGKLTLAELRLTATRVKLDTLEQESWRSIDGVVSSADDLDRLRQDMERLMAERDTLRAERDTLRAERDTLEQESWRSVDGVVSSADDMDRLRAERDFLRAELQQRQDEAAGLPVRLEDSERERQHSAAIPQAREASLVEIGRQPRERHRRHRRRRHHRRQRRRRHEDWSRFELTRKFRKNMALWDILKLRPL